MKTTLLFVFAFVIGISLSAQQIAKIPAEKAKVKAAGTIKPSLLETTNLNGMFRPGDGPRTAGVDETEIGGTIYDLQSNGSIQNRMYAYPDGTIGAVWTMGFGQTSFTDRGTGYNYFDGTTWKAEPTARIENARCGWPSYCPLGNGELVVTHNGSTALLVSKRPTRGTGSWTTTQLVGPSVGGSTALLWPRAITNGNTIHIIACTEDQSAYQGLTDALVYYRSTNGGSTWEGPTILPGLDAASLNGNPGFAGYGGDCYSWAAPKGDTIAFVVGNLLGGVWIMKSYDNGTTWHKITVYEFPHFTGTESPDAATFDEIYSVALDNQGKAHFVGSRYKMTGMDATANPVSWYYYPYTDGIVYWNEDMPVIDTSYLNNPDTLFNHGMWIGSMVDYNGNGEIDFPDAGSGNYPWGDYRYAGLSSFGQIIIDKDNNIFVSFSALREDLVNAGANPTVQLYRHLYLTSKLSYEGEWCEPRDLNDDILHSYDECVWASMAWSTDDRLHFLYHLDPEPGTAVGADGDDYGDNFVYYLTFPTFVGTTKPVDISKDVVISPNPASDYANIQISTPDNRKIELKIFDVTGRLVSRNNYGEIAGGTHTFKVNTESLPSGVYLFNVKAGASQTTKKVIVK